MIPSDGIQHIQCFRFFNTHEKFEILFQILKFIYILKRDAVVQFPQSLFRAHYSHPGPDILARRSNWKRIFISLLDFVPILSRDDFIFLKTYLQ